jgi:hypothetical protein
VALIQLKAAKSLQGSPTGGCYSELDVETVIQTDELSMFLVCPATRKVPGVVEGATVLSSYSDEAKLGMLKQEGGRVQAFEHELYGCYLKLLDNVLFHGRLLILSIKVMQVPGDPSELESTVHIAVTALGDKPSFEGGRMSRVQDVCTCNWSNLVGHGCRRLRYNTSGVVWQR